MLLGVPLVAGCAGQDHRVDASGSSAGGSAGASTGASDSGSPAELRTILRPAVEVSGDLEPARLTAVADSAQRAAARVRQVWGAGGRWGEGQRAKVIAVRTHARFTELGGDSSDQVAATTRSDGVVLISQPALDELTSSGVDAVLAHELTHVRLGTPDDVPRWMLEGPAEYTAWLTSGLPLARYAPSLRDRVAAGRPPQGPPDDGAFATTTDEADLRAAYQDALAWCAFLVSRHGRARWVATVISALDGGGSASDRFAAAYGAPGALRSSFRNWLDTTL